MNLFISKMRVFDKIVKVFKLDFHYALPTRRT